ncbi:MAG: transglycosylase SLT domain-containing protein, partial [Acidobacteriota bacterium]|nr:transglycosylase SLT domain-containing protein [Acidobacteriota bacterium]
MGSTLILSACGAKVRTVAAPQPVPVAVQAPPPVAPAAKPSDPIDILIADSDKQFAEGQKHLQAGHLEQARLAFDRAIEMLLESPYGARTEPRLRLHFDRLVDRINALEVIALRQGDGFTEKRAEPAAIDLLLAASTVTPAAPKSATRDAVAADLSQFSPAFPISLNSRVLSYVEAFQGSLRPFLTDGLTRAGRYLPMIERVFREEGLPLELAYVPLIESAFKPSAKSRVSAQGVWQFMVPTARDFGLRYDWFIDERSDPEKSTVAAAKYLKMLHRIFDGDWALALASYNGGQGRVQRAVKNSGINDFWGLTSTSSYLPRETREYVPMIMAAMVIAKNPLKYGFELRPLSPLAYDTVRVPGAVDLRRVAEWADVSLDDIEQLNPELRRWTTPIDYANYELKVPTGRGTTLTQRLAKADPDELVAFKRHHVRRGETLTTIARKFHLARTQLAVANGLGSKARVRVGQTLIIPRAQATALASSTRQAPAAARQASASRTAVSRSTASRPGVQ